MKIHIIKTNGDSEILDANIVHISDYCSICERSNEVQFWSDPIQHDKVNQRIEIIFKK